MGTGTGFLASIAAENSEEVIGVDIDEESIEYAKKNFPNVKFFVSDLFSNVEGRFDLIIFNPPYLPPSDYDNGIDTTDNGVIKRFLSQARDYLKPNGKILLLISSLTKIKKDYGYVWKKLDEMNVGFEKLYVYQLRI